MKKRFPKWRDGRINRGTPRLPTGDRLLRLEPLEPRLCLSVGQLLSHWTFDNEHVIGNVVLDASSVGGVQSGILTNGGPATDVVGVVGDAADFAGGANNLDNEFVDLGVHAGTFGALAFGTIAAWVRPEVNGVDNPTDRLTIFSVSNSGAPSEEMTFAIDNGTNAGKLSYIVRDGATLGNVTSSSSDLLNGQWHHVAVTVGFGNTTRIYIDGVPEDSATVPFLNALMVDSSAMGRNRDSNAGGGQWFFGGQMDDVGLWDNALTGAEVKALVSLAEHPQLNYDLGQAEELFNLSDAETGSVVIGGRTWTATPGLSSEAGVIVADDTGALSLLLDADNGVGVRSEAVPFVVTSTADIGPGTLRAMID